MRNCEKAFMEMRNAFGNVPKACIVNFIKLLQYIGLYEKQ